MGSFYPKVHDVIMQGFSNAPAVLQLFSMLRQAERETRAEASRPRLVTNVLLTATDRFSHYTRLALTANDIGGVRFNYDLICGLSNTAALIRLAEDELAGRNDAIALYVLETEMSDPERIYSTAADSYTSAQTEGERCAEILKQDPTGLKVIEYGIQTLRTEEPWSPSWQSRAYTVAGAELTRDAYKVLYEISDRLK